MVLEGLLRLVLASVIYLKDLTKGLPGKPFTISLGYLQRDKVEVIVLFLMLETNHYHLHSILQGPPVQLCLLPLGVDHMMG